MAVRNVGRNARRSIITGITILFGVMMVLLVRGVTGGMARLMIEDAVLGKVGALQVHRKGFVDNIDSVPTRLNMEDTPALRAKLAAVPHVTAVTGRITFQGLVSNGVQQTMFVGRGLELSTEGLVCPRSATQVLEGGRSLQPGDAQHATLGFELAQSFALQPGQTVSVQTTSPQGRANALDLKVLGFTTSSLPFENKRVLTVPLQTAQALLGLEGHVTEYALSIDDLDRVGEVQAALQATLGPDFEVHAWSDIQPFVRDLIARITFVLAGVGTVLFVIVLTGIINTMLMSVYERTREIGTLLALGVRRAQVMRLFLLEAAVIGAAGAVAGGVVGQVLVHLLALKGLPVPVSGLSTVNVLRPATSLGFTLATMLGAALGAVGAATWPSLRASKMNPVDALRQ
jgi:putative ABC transport system permease protein